MARQEVVIGTTTFYLNTFAPRDALRIFGDLQKDLLPSLGGVLASVASEDGGDINPETLLAGIKSFSVSLDGKALDAWCDRLIDPERVTYEKNGKDARKLTKANMDDAFEDFAEILELLFHIIKLNFAGPLGRWLGLSGPGLKEKLGNQLESSNRNSSES